MVSSVLGTKPLDRALFAAFAEWVRAAGNRPVADVGCGPGRVTVFLKDLGLDAFGGASPSADRQHRSAA
jgi:hypothetical protein